MEKDIRETEGQAHGNPPREESGAKSLSCMAGESIYGRGDMVFLQGAAMPGSNYVYSLSAIDDLLERDKLREKTAFRVRSALESWSSPAAAARVRSSWCPPRWRKNSFTTCGAANREVKGDRRAERAKARKAKSSERNPFTALKALGPAQVRGTGPSMK